MELDWSGFSTQLEEIKKEDTQQQREIVDILSNENTEIDTVVSNTPTKDSRVFNIKKVVRRTQ